MSGPIQTSPHDTLFRHAFGQAQNAAGLLKALLPAGLVATVDWETLAQREGNHVDEHLRELESDLVFSARVAGRETLFYFLVEHQSSPDRFMALRLWQYVNRVWEKWRRDHDGARYPAARRPHRRLSWRASVERAADARGAPRG
ncbi:MAG: Rpn family recombination-promoting nuclease/putative transposase [Sandaracinaceae bacterium]|nr:Rpn family recombination-promoting nuclease/putative transposase [Sandaracinaceae bacterium]